MPYGNVRAGVCDECGQYSSVTQKNFATGKIVCVTCKNKGK